MDRKVLNLGNHGLMSGTEHAPRRHNNLSLSRRQLYNERAPFQAPGVYWAGVFGVAIPAVVLENIPVGQALPRSSDLTQNFRSRVIIVFFLTTIFSGIMKYALNAGLELLWPIIHPHFVHLTKLNLRDISSVLALTLFAPISAIGLTLVYYDLRVRKEPFDLMMDRMGDAETVSAESAQQSAVGSQ